MVQLAQPQFLSSVAFASHTRPLALAVSCFCLGRKKASPFHKSNTRSAIPDVHRSLCNRSNQVCVASLLYLGPWLLGVMAVLLLCRRLSGNRIKRGPEKYTPPFLVCFLRAPSSASLVACAKTPTSLFSFPATNLYAMFSRVLSVMVCLLAGAAAFMTPSVTVRAVSRPTSSLAMVRFARIML